jgi:TPR repeat protein
MNMTLRKRVLRVMALSGCLLLGFTAYMAFYLPRCGSGADCLALGERFEQGRSVPVDLPLAARFFEKACKRGAATGCFKLGWFYARGVAGSPDLARAASYYDRACRGHVANGCFFLSLAYAAGSGVTKNAEVAASLVAGAVPLYETACQSGDGSACTHLAGMFAKGDGVSADLPRSKRFAEQACLLGELGNCIGPGEAYLMGANGAPRDLRRARVFLNHACQGGKGMAVGCCALATTYASGDDVDESRASMLFEKACSLGQGEACIALYQARQEVSLEVRNALQVFAESCSKPYPPVGCSNCQFSDAGSQTRRVAALRRLEVACDDGHYEACLVLGLMTPLSEGSMAFLERACSHDLAPACHRLAYDVAFDKHGTLEQNVRRATELERKACDLGLAVACPSPQ